MNRRTVVRLSFVSLGLVQRVLSVGVGGAEQDVWIEAESFETLGGWVIDQPSVDQMGSAYVMAHGMGVPSSPSRYWWPLLARGANFWKIVVGHSRRSWKGMDGK